MFIIFLFLIPNVFGQWASVDVARTRFSGICGERGQFDCGAITITGEPRCISIVKFHDGVPDCDDHSDEFCFPGQIRCGDHCANLESLSDCIMNPRCDDVYFGMKASPDTQHPLSASFCPFLKRKLCVVAGAVPCKGYGECVLRKWLLDGKSDCFDGSDEDPDFASLFHIADPLPPHIRPKFVSTGGEAKSQGALPCPDAAPPPTADPDPPPPIPIVATSGEAETRKSTKSPKKATLASLFLTLFPGQPTGQPPYSAASSSVAVGKQGMTVDPPVVEPLNVGPGIGVFFGMTASTGRPPGIPPNGKMGFPNSIVGVSSGGGEYGSPSGHSDGPGTEHGGAGGSGTEFGNSGGSKPDSGHSHGSGAESQHSGGSGGKPQTPSASPSPHGYPGYPPSHPNSPPLPDHSPKSPSHFQKPAETEDLDDDLQRFPTAHPSQLFRPVGQSTLYPGQRLSTASTAKSAAEENPTLYPGQRTSWKPLYPGQRQPTPKPKTTTTTAKPTEWPNGGTFETTVDFEDRFDGFGDAFGPPTRPWTPHTPPTRPTPPSMQPQPTQVGWLVFPPTWEEIGAATLASGGITVDLPASRGADGRDRWPSWLRGSPAAPTATAAVANGVATFYPGQRLARPPPSWAPPAANSVVDRWNPIIPTTITRTTYEGGDDTAEPTAEAETSPVVVGGGAVIIWPNGTVSVHPIASTAKGGEQKPTATTEAKIPVASPPSPHPIPVAPQPQPIPMAPQPVSAVHRLVGPLQPELLYTALPSLPFLPNSPLSPPFGPFSPQPLPTLPSIPFTTPRLLPWTLGPTVATQPPIRASTATPPSIAPIYPDEITEHLHKATPCPHQPPKPHPPAIRPSNAPVGVPAAVVPHVAATTAAPTTKAAPIDADNIQSTFGDYGDLGDEWGDITTATAKTPKTTTPKAAETEPKAETIAATTETATSTPTTTAANAATAIESGYGDTAAATIATTKIPISTISPSSRIGTRPPSPIASIAQWAPIPFAVGSAIAALRRPHEGECSDNVREVARRHVRNPECLCAVGEMPTKERRCERTPDIATIRVRVDKVCGSDFTGTARDAAQIALLRIADGVATTACVRGDAPDAAKGVAVLNVLCGDGGRPANCSLADLRRRLRDSALNTEDPLGRSVSLRLDALQNGGPCSSGLLNDCGAEADCVAKGGGLHYRCLCSDGSAPADGRSCSVAGGCTRLLGICLILWLLLAPLLLCVLPILCAYVAWRCGCGRDSMLWEKARDLTLCRDKYQTDGESRASARAGSPPIRHNEGLPRAPDAPIGGISAASARLSDAPNSDHHTPDYYRNGPMAEGGAESAEGSDAETASRGLVSLVSTDDGGSAIGDKDLDHTANAIAASAIGGALAGDRQTVAADIHPHFRSERRVSSAGAAQTAEEMAAAVAHRDAQRRRESAASRVGTPTIWESYQILGRQYSQGKEAQKDSSTSLDSLMNRYQDREFARLLRDDPNFAAEVQKAQRDANSLRPPLAMGATAVAGGMAAVRDGLQEGTSALRDGVRGAVGNVRDGFREGSNALRDGAVGTLRDGANVLRDGANAVRDGVSSIRDGAVGAISDANAAIGGAANNASNWATGTMRNATSAIDATTGAIAGAASGAVGAVGSAIAGPSVSFAANAQRIPHIPSPIPPTPQPQGSATAFDRLNAKTGDELCDRCSTAGDPDHPNHLRVESPDASSSTALSSATSPIALEEAIRMAEEIGAESRERRRLLGGDDSEDLSTGEDSLLSTIPQSPNSDELFHYPRVEGDYEFAEDKGGGGSNAASVKSSGKSKDRKSTAGSRDANRTEIGVGMPLRESAAAAAAKAVATPRSRQAAAAAATELSKRTPLKTVGDLAQSRAARAKPPAATTTTPRHTKPPVPEEARRPPKAPGRAATVAEKKETPAKTATAQKPTSKSPAKSAIPTRPAKPVTKSDARQLARQFVTAQPTKPPVKTQSLPNTDRSRPRPRLPVAAAPTSGSTSSSPATAAAFPHRSPSLPAIGAVAQRGRGFGIPLDLRGADFQIADIDLDLPGPHMVPATMDDIRSGRLREVLRHGRTRAGDDSDGAAAHSATDMDVDATATKSVVTKTPSRLPPVVEERKAKATITATTKEITVERVRGMAEPGDPRENAKEIPLIAAPDSADEPSASEAIEERVHEHCLTDRPPWDPTPLRPGDLDAIPLDWNLTRTDSLLSFAERRRSRSFHDLFSQPPPTLMATAARRRRTKSFCDLRPSRRRFSDANLVAAAKRERPRWTDRLRESLRPRADRWLDYD